MFCNIIIGDIIIIKSEKYKISEIEWIFSPDHATFLHKLLLVTHISMTDILLAAYRPHTDAEYLPCTQS